jgi:DNA-directed RNA polymerase specialized sigma24 family protein
MASTALARPTVHLAETARRKYHFTPAIDEDIRRAYHLFLDYNNRRAISACARKLQMPRWAINRRAAVLGLARIKEPESSAAEIAILEGWGHLTDAVIQRKLKTEGFHRSINGVHLKMRRLRIKKNLDGYSANALATAFGVDSHKVTYWINRQMLKATRRGTARTESQGGDTYWITHSAVREFVLKHPDEIDLRKVEKWWFLDLVTDGRIGIR